MPRKILILVLFLLLIGACPAYAADLILDGELIAQDDLFECQNDVQVPVKPVLEELGYQVAFDPKEGLLTAHKGKEQVELYLGEAKCLFNDINKKLSDAPRLVSGKMYLAAQDLGKLFNLKGAWEAGGKSYSFVSTPTLTEEDIVGHLLAADRQMMRAEYYNNQDFLRQHGIAPSPVLDRKNDLEELLGMHWSATMINALWQGASQEGHYVGFYSEGEIPLSYNKELAILERTPSSVKVRALMPQWEDDGTTNFVDRIYTLNLNEAGNLVITNIE